MEGFERETTEQGVTVADRGGDKAVDDVGALLAWD